MEMDHDGEIECWGWNYFRTVHTCYRVFSGGFVGRQLHLRDRFGKSRRMLGREQLRAPVRPPIWDISTNLFGRKSLVRGPNKRFGRVTRDPPVGRLPRPRFGNLLINRAGVLVAVHRGALPEDVDERSISSGRSGFATSTQ
jgi:hypothetical protein